MYDLSLLPSLLSLDQIKQNPDLREDILFEASFASSMQSMCSKYHTTPEIIHELIEEFKDTIPYYRQYRERRLADKIFDKKEMAYDRITGDKLDELNAKDLAMTGNILNEAEKSLRGEATKKVSLEFDVLNKEIPTLNSNAKAKLIYELRQSLGIGKEDNALEA